MPSRRAERDLPIRMRFMELDTTLDVQRRGSELPDRPVELLDRQARHAHRMQEVSPGDFARLGAATRFVEEC